MTFQTLLSYSQSLLIHSIFHKYSPSSLHNTWKTNNECRLENFDINLRNGNDLFVPPVRTEQLKKLPYFFFPSLWNSLHEQKFTANEFTFKIELKKRLLEN